ncbi:hypothetical protein Efla_006621 [Eimeria flavescens]
MGLTTPAEEAAAAATIQQKSEGAETAATTSPASPGVCLVLTEPLSPQDYATNFAEGDIDERFRTICCRDVAAFRGSWQLLLGGRSDSVEQLLCALGISMLKRKVIASFASVTDVQLVECNQQQQQQQQTGSSSSICCPTLQLTTHLPLKNTKQGVFCFDGTCCDIQDSDTGKWETRCVWLHGRALQKRWNASGVMWDARCVFAEDPLESNKQRGAVMLFQVGQ